MFTHPDEDDLIKDTFLFFDTPDCRAENPEKKLNRRKGRKEEKEGKNGKNGKEEKI